MTLVIISILAFILRLYGINWDQGFHLHPDERMLIMVADRIHFMDQLNPQFFNYGSLPIYFLKGMSQLIDSFFLTNLANYDDMLYVGRVFSIAADIITLILLYQICLLLFKKKNLALFAAFLYGIAFFPIQNTHFFVVDVFLTCFTTLLVFVQLLYLKKATYLHLLYISVAFAAAAATKVTAIIFLPVIILTIAAPYLKNHIVKQIPLLLAKYAFFAVVFFLLHFFFMPYAYIEHLQFISDIKLQTTMNSNPYIFPYTLQYVTTLPYLYYLKNIFLWGLGPVISLLSIGGIVLAFAQLKLISLKNIKSIKFLQNYVIKHQVFILVGLFYAVYFIVIGRSAVKFMRYMLPMYPFLCMMAAYGVEKLPAQLKKGTLIALTVLTLLWTISFVNMYSFPHTRLTATNWILKNIPPGSTIATEHWDDLIPLHGGENYRFVQMTLYDRPDNDAKWTVLNNNLKQTDYIILASNRLYVPLPKLKDCKIYGEYCYPKTTEYYQKLFSGQLGFTKVAEFKVQPTLPFLNFITFSDQSADESFTVYDHPTIFIFKKK